MAVKKHPRSDLLNPAEIVATSDIITEILVRLPVKKIIQYKLVLKQWISFITSSGFDHLRDSHQIPKIVRHFASCMDFVSIWHVDFFQFPAMKGNLSRLKPINLSEDPQGIKILQSCKGLLLCSNFRLNKGRLRYYVIKPQTDEFSVICEPDGVNVILGVRLVFDPSKSHHYKVVYVMRPKLLNVFHINIYSSETCVWRLSGEHFSKNINYEDVVYWNGSIHWIERCGLLNGNKLLCYDIQDHVFKKMPYVQLCSSNYYYLGKSRDRLNLFSFGEPNYQLGIYQMKNDYSGWYMRRHVKLSPMFDAYSEMFKLGLDKYPFRLLSVVRGEKEEDTFLVLGTQDKTVRCNIYSQLINKWLA